ncbi:PREDICTED: nudix hydrolase 15, mitochondrial-like isoform X1 [Populus euphratica]|uniref:Nudix hydrolase 15, mitochondrial-like isoform X1 n=1 Tax=Populus euphratica TaxID=75702 RepID=A0AAJ6XQX3_POPEU|nr:PREDICTED: nudix hydrolase 15, mitochondrial-like isoform X1 [Populus euphratica]
MASENRGEKSQKLVSLSRRLRLYEPPPHLNNPARRQHGIPKSANPKRAAVLICIFEGNGGELRVILTQRSSQLSSHSGEVALPGGKREEGDADDIATALREAKEEIGLDPSLVDVVTVIEPYMTRFNVTVIPVIGILFDKKAFNPTPDAGEVESVFDVPLEMFLKNENRRDVEDEWMGDKFLCHFFDYQSGEKGFMIWAITAAILIRVATIVYQTPPAFLERRPTFWNGIPDKDLAKL